MANKMTKKVALETLAVVVNQANVAEKDELLSFITKELETLAKKAVRTSADKGNDVLLASLREVLAEKVEPVNIATLLKDPRLATFTNNKGEVIETSGQKLSALLKKLKDSGEVVRTEIKKKAFFSLA